MITVGFLMTLFAWLGTIGLIVSTIGGLVSIFLPISESFPIMILMIFVCAVMAMIGTGALPGCGV